MSIQDPPALWDTALNELELQMTRATFDTWLRGTRCTGTDEDGNLVIEVKNEYAVEWLTHRLNNPIERTLQRITGNGTRAVYVVAEQEALEAPPETSEPPPPPEPQQLTQTLYELLDQVGDREAKLLIQQKLAELQDAPLPPPSPTGWQPPEKKVLDRGWYRISQYASKFWGPYLGARVFRLWEIIFRTDKRRKKTEWTPPRRFSAPTLAQELGCCRQTISGTWRRCEAEADGAVLRVPQDTFHAEDEEPEPEYFRRRKGLLERLVDAGIAQVNIEGTRSRKVYEVSVVTNLGWLTPAQLATLPAEVQEEHDAFVADMGLDPTQWRIG
jgi:hypothetical protein